VEIPRGRGFRDIRPESTRLYLSVAPRRELRDDGAFQEPPEAVIAPVT